jgi:hypothetical protein
MALGKIAFLGSGETSLAGGRIFESLVRDGDTRRFRVEFRASGGASR